MRPEQGEGVCRERAPLLLQRNDSGTPPSNTRAAITYLFGNLGEGRRKKEDILLMHGLVAAVYFFLASDGGGEVRYNKGVTRVKGDD